MPKNLNIIDDAFATKAIEGSETDLSAYSGILESSAKLLMNLAYFTCTVYNFLA